MDEWEKMFWEKMYRRRMELPDKLDYPGAACRHHWHEHEESVRHACGQEDKTTTYRKCCNCGLTDMDSIMLRWPKVKELPK